VLRRRTSQVGVRLERRERLGGLDDLDLLPRRRRASQRARAGSGEARNTTRFIGRFFTSFMPVEWNW
jgi:hypothetical protein